MFLRTAFSRISSALRSRIRGGKLRTRDVHNFQYFRAMSSAQPSLNICGIFPPLAIPFDEDENISYEKLEENMKKWNKIDFGGYIIGGSNGEPVYLNSDERIEMVKKAKQFSSPDKLLIAGSGCESTRDTIQMTKAMADAGADAVMVVTPCYFKSLMNNQALEQHYLKLADQSPVPVILYSVPGNTTIDLSPEVIISVSAHPNIIGIKDSGGDVAKLANLVYNADKDFQILSGSVSFMYPAMTVDITYSSGACIRIRVMSKVLESLIYGHDLLTRYMKY